MGIAICFSSNTKGFNEKANRLMLAISAGISTLMFAGLPI